MRYRKLFWIHFLLNLAAFILMQTLVYEPLLCFNIFHPLSSIGRCSKFAFLLNNT